MLPNTPSGAALTDQRCIARHQLGGFLQVYNRHTGKPIGYLGNISKQGMMLISSLPVMLGACYELQLRLPLSTSASTATDAELVDFSARSHWCRADASPGNYDSGFSIISNQQAFADLARALERYFSFTHPVDV
ncbi:hypothetical protein [Halopseudomonas pelagia]|uniref:hypothetical protein n=1 Tax=Halopseudomonas pelagia TaxID=553151 RepID=UPI0003A98135|nr:hypothetical protein [Halopseudomonas pelagia]|tara:strand:- start:2209 stop:2610 length:402 start_codon:yes stop_codon:yes gene_type:complete